MRNVALSLSILGAACAYLLPVAPAQAQATRTWVSGVGDDVNPCSRTAPCKTFAGAISKTAANGEINCLDPGGFGAVTITKSITIDCGGTFGSILASGTNGIVISNADTTTTVNVVLRNLSINGTGASPGLNGIRFLIRGTLHVDHVMVQNFTAAGSGFGIDFRPTGTSNLIVSNSYLFNNGTGSGGGAVNIRPTGGGITATIDRTVADRGSFHGFIADGAGGAAGTVVNLAVTNSVAVENGAGAGIIATSAGNTVQVMVDRTTSSHNGVGMQTSGAGSSMRIGHSSVTGNAVGLSNGGGMTSYKNNQINGNGADGTPIPQELLN